MKQNRNKTNSETRILIYGAGVIGSLYAAYLSRAGCSVSMLARGHRLEELRENGLLYRQKNGVFRAEVTVLEYLAPDDIYDCIFLTVRAEQLYPALSELHGNKSPTIVTMVNSPDPYDNWETLCGKGRILPAFPGAGGGLVNGVLDAALTPRWVQPTAFGEIGGAETARVRQLKALLRQAGIPCQVVPDMHAWQLCHLAMVVPLADAYYRTDRDPAEAGQDKTVMRLTAETLRRNFRVLRQRNCAISPRKLQLLLWCPVGITAIILSLVYRSRFGVRFMYRHAMKARAEMDILHREFYAFLDNLKKGT